MRIVLFTSAATKSGGARQAYYLAAGLRERGHQLTFCVPQRSTLNEVDPAFDFVRLPKRRSQWRAVVEQAAGDGPAIVHGFHSKALKCVAWWSMGWRFGLRKRSYVAIASRGVCHVPSNPLPYIAPSMDAFTANSGACGEVMMRVGAPRTKVRLLHNGVPQARVTPARTPQAVREELGAGAHTFVVGTVAGDKPVKGVDVLMDAFAKLVAAGDADSLLVLVGCNPTKWGPIVEGLGIAERVRIIPRTENVADYLSAYDCFVLPSRGRQESMPNTMLEALFLGVPVVGTSVGGVPEVAGRCGLVVAPDDVAATTAAISRMRDDEPFRRTCAQAAREASAQFTLDARVEAAETLYTELLSTRGLLG